MRRGYLACHHLNGPRLLSTSYMPGTGMMRLPSGILCSHLCFTDECTKAQRRTKTEHARLGTLTQVYSALRGALGWPEWSQVTSLQPTLIAVDDPINMLSHIKAMSTLPCLGDTWWPSSGARRSASHGCPLSYNVPPTWASCSDSDSMPGPGSQTRQASMISSNPQIC